jgi:polysaccharide deacetylase 2 family uncharacterized protein YibQ
MYYFNPIKIKTILRIIKKITLVLTCILSIGFANAAKIAIVIDDIGNNLSDNQLLTLDENLTYAILPHTPYSFIFSKKAAELQRDILIHLPMQATTQNILLGPGALTQGMSKRQYQKTLIAAIEDIPYAIGINNHMGSLLTRLDKPMRWTMELLQQHNMFFLDSKTTVYSKVESIADQYGVNALHRNIFLDNVKKPNVMDIQFKRLINIAQEYGSAIAIAHPYPETYEFLRDNLPQLSSMGIELVPLSQLLPSSKMFNDRIIDNVADDFVKATATKNNNDSE